MISLHALNGLPQLIESPLPNFNSDHELLLDTVRQELDESAHQWNGQCLVYVRHTIDENNHCIITYAWGEYAHVVAGARYSELGIKQLCVNLLLQSPQGFLFQRRSGSVRWPNQWDLTVTGGVEQPNLYRALSEEADQELQMSLPDSTQPCALSQTDSGIDVIFHAYVQQIFEPVVNDEVVEWRWAQDMSNLQPGLPIMEVWDALQELLP